MARKKTPPWKGLSDGPIMVACQWNKSSPMGPAEHDDGGSRPRSVSSLLMRFKAISNGMLWHRGVESTGGLVTGFVNESQAAGGLRGEKRV